MLDEEAFSGDPKDKSELISKNEKQQRELEAKGHCFLGAFGSSNDGNKPSKECKAAMFQALYKWFKETPFTNLNRIFLALGRLLKRGVFEPHAKAF